MKIKKMAAGVLAASMAVSCMALSASAVTVEEAEAAVAAMNEGDIFLARFNEDGSLSQEFEIFEDYNIPPDDMPECGRKAYKCTVLSDGTLSITMAASMNDPNYGLYLVIPENIFGRTVTAIVVNPYMGYNISVVFASGSPSITIPATVTLIEPDAISLAGESGVIYGVPGSCAETYANDNGYTFMALTDSDNSQPAESDEETNEPAESDEETNEPANEDNTQAAAPSDSDNAQNDSPAGDTQKPTESGKGNADTGAEGVAVIAAVAVVAAGAVVIGKKRK